MTEHRFSQRGRLNSWHGGWRTIAFRVEHQPAWWRRKQWVVLMDYFGGTFSDRDVVCSRHRSVDEANAKAEQSWADVVADHERIEAHQAAKR